MALSCIVRRGCASIFPVSIRSVASQRAFHGYNSLNFKTHCDMGTQFLRYSGFSTAASKKLGITDDDANFISLIDTAIKSEQKTDYHVQHVPDDFPFEIGSLDHGQIELTRKYLGEKITVYAYIRDEDDGDDNQNRIFRPSVEFYVQICKWGELRFNLTTSPPHDQIAIDSVEIYKADYPNLGSDYHLIHDMNKETDKTLQKAFLKYLEIRGIKPSLANFLLEYARKGPKKELLERNEHLLFLTGMKDFIEN